MPTGESGTVYFELTSRRPAGDLLEKELRDTLSKHGLLGLNCRDGVPINPTGPGLAVRIRLDDASARVQYSTTHAKDNAWLPLGKLELPLLNKDKAPRPAPELADKLGRIAPGTPGRRHPDREEGQGEVHLHLADRQRLPVDPQRPLPDRQR